MTRFWKLPPGSPERREAKREHFRKYPSRPKAKVSRYRGDKLEKTRTAWINNRSRMRYAFRSQAEERVAFYMARAGVQPLPDSFEVYQHSDGRIFVLAPVSECRIEFIPDMGEITTRVSIEFLYAKEREAINAREAAKVQAPSDEPPAPLEKTNEEISSQ